MFLLHFYVDQWWCCLHIFDGAYANAAQAFKIACFFEISLLLSKCKQKAKQQYCITRKGQFSPVKTRQIMNTCSLKTKLFSEFPKKQTCTFGQPTCNCSMFPYRVLSNKQKQTKTTRSRGGQSTSQLVLCPKVFSMFHPGIITTIIIILIIVIIPLKIINFWERQLI